MKKVLVFFALLVLLTPAFAVTYNNPGNTSSADPVKGVSEFFGGIVDFVRVRLSVPATSNTAVAPSVSGSYSSSVAVGVTKGNEAKKVVQVMTEQKEFEALVHRVNNALNLSDADYRYLHEKFGNQYHVHVYPIFSDGSKGSGVHVVLNGNSLELILPGEKTPARTIHDAEITVNWQWLKEQLKSGRLQESSWFELLFSDNLRVPLDFIPRLNDVANLPSIRERKAFVDVAEVAKYETDAKGVN